MTAEKKDSPAVRLASLDALRGFDMLFIMGGEGLLCALVPAAWGAVVLQVGYVAVCWLFLYSLSRHKVFLKV